MVANNNKTILEKIRQIRVGPGSKNFYPRLDPFRKQALFLSNLIFELIFLTQTFSFLRGSPVWAGGSIIDQVELLWEAEYGPYFGMGFMPQIVGLGAQETASWWICGS